MVQKYRFKEKKGITRGIYGYVIDSVKESKIDKQKRPLMRVKKHQWEKRKKERL